MHVNTKTIFNITLPLGPFFAPQSILQPQMLLSTKRNYIKMNVKYMQFTLIAHDFSKRFFHYINNEVTQTWTETNFTTNSGVNLMISHHI